jgi:hypothetical protein
MVMPNKEIKPLRFNKVDKFAPKIENEIDSIGNAATQTVKAYEINDPHSSMFHRGNITQLTRDVRSSRNYDSNNERCN